MQQAQGGGGVEAGSGSAGREGGGAKEAKLQKLFEEAFSEVDARLARSKIDADNRFVCVCDNDVASGWPALSCIQYSPRPPCYHYSGSTGIVANLVGGNVVTAWVGDSRGLLGRKDAFGWKVSWGFALVGQWAGVARRGPLALLAPLFLPHPVLPSLAMLHALPLPADLPPPHCPPHPRRCSAFSSSASVLS